MAAPTSLTFDFSQKVLGADSSGGLVLNPSADVLAALLADQPFPAKPITLAGASLQAQGGKDIVFDGGKGKVTFGAHAAASLEVNADPARVVAGLTLADPIASGLSFPADPAGGWAGLSWSYGLQGAAHGALGLGEGVKATFGADAKQTGAFAVLHRFDRTTPARRVLADLVASWRLPRQVRGADDLRPATWLVAELDGSLAVSLGVQYGYKFNWLRQVEGRLSGDIALRLQLALQATVGFTAAGRYALVVSRPSPDPAQKVLRLQIFKQRKKGWSFAFDAGAKARADLGDVAPPTLEGLLRAVLGVHDGQILEDLKEWLDPQKSLGQLLAGAGEGYAKTFLKEVTGVDVAAVAGQFDAARGRLSGFLKRWDTLDQRVAASLWERIGDETYVKAVRHLAAQISVAAGDEPTRQLIVQHLRGVDFFRSPEGRWLTAQAGGGLLSLLEDPRQLQELRQVADHTVAILGEDGSLDVARRLKKAIAQRFGLDKIEAQLKKAIDASDPKALDAWLSGRLADWLDEQPAVRHLNDLKNAINGVREKGQALYEKTLKALQRQYEADLAVSYQKSTEGTALLDVDFDFAKDDGTLAALFHETVTGDFRRLLVEPHAGVALHKGTLTHEIRRERHVDLTLPSSFAEMKSINQALASVSAIDDGGRVLLYEVSGANEVDIATAKSRRDSRLSLVAHLPVRVTGLRRHEEASLDFSYSFHQAAKDMRKEQLESQVGAYVAQYLAGQFPADGDGTSSGAFALWVDDFDRQLEVLEKNGTGNLGNTLISLELGVPPEVGRAWLKAPPAGSPVYLDMSLRLQRKLKELIPFYYFQDLEAYGNPASAALLAYAAIPASNGVRIKGDALVPDGNGLHWDYPDSKLRAALIHSQRADRNLERTIARIQGLLGKVPGLRNIADRYADTRRASDDLRSRALSTAMQPFLFSLLNVESKLVHGAAAAAAKLSQLSSKAATDPEKALAALADFAGALAEVFNEDVWSIYGKSALRPLGTLLFAEAATAFDPTLRLDTSALLRISIVKGDVKPFPPAKFPDDSGLKAEQILIEQTIVSA